MFLQQRLDYEIYTLPLDLTKEVSQPERVLIYLGKGNGYFDLGALCYLERDFGKRGLAKPANVNLTSFCKSRARIVSKLIEYFDNQVRFGARRPRTLKKISRHLIKFIDWCDRNNFNFEPKNPSHLKSLFRDYVYELRRLVDQHRISLNVAVMEHNDVILAVEEAFEIEALDSGINLIRKDSRLIRNTEVPDELAMSRAIEWSECLLNGFFDLLANSRPYPYELKVPKYLGTPKNTLWVFPFEQWSATRNTKSLKIIQVDYENGTIRTPEEVQPYSKNRLSTLRTHNEVTRNHISKANAERYHWSRIDRGILAIKAYMVLLLATSGQPASVIAGLPWSEELETQALQKTATRQQFRSIKYRAGGSEVTFEVGVRHLPALQTFLRLRRFLLQGRKCDHLFFNFGANTSSEKPVPFSSTSAAVNTYYKSIRRLDPTLVSVTPREFRAAKGDFLIRTTDLSTAALAMQHSQQTAMKYYANGSQKAHINELATFFKAIEERVKDPISKDTKQSNQERANGHCAAPEPMPILENSPIPPDCKTPEGCLFCRQYYAHADKHDAKKLLSARVCINYRAHRAKSFEESDAVYQPILSVIDILLDQIRSYAPGVVAAAQHEVEELGDLTPYWENKMYIMNELENLN